MGTSDNGPRDQVVGSRLPRQLYHVDDIFNPLIDAPPDPPPLVSASSIRKPRTTTTSTTIIITTTTTTTPSTPSDYLASSYQSASAPVAPLHYYCHYESNYSYAAQRSTRGQPSTPQEGECPQWVASDSPSHNYDFYDHNFHPHPHQHPPTDTDTDTSMLLNRRREDDCPLEPPTNASSSSITPTYRTVGILFTIFVLSFVVAVDQWRQQLTRKNHP